jgi:hypothetical protein
MSLPLIEVEKELAKQRMMRGTPSQNFGEGRALEVVGKKIGVSDETLRMALKVLEKAPQEELEKLRSGEIAISRLYKQIESTPEEPKPWKCDGCFKEFKSNMPEKPVAVIMCPYCVLDFQAWKADKNYENKEANGRNE